MKCALLLLALGACGGPFSGARLEPVTESQSRALLTITVPSLDRTDAVMRGWPGGDPEVWPLRQLLFALYGVGTEASREVAGDRPVGACVALDGERPVYALAFSLRGSVSPREWLATLGEVRARSGPFALVVRGQSPAPMYGGAPEALYFHAEGDTLIVSGTLRGLLVAGPAAQAVRGGSGGDLVVAARPRAWPRASLLAFLAFLRGQTWAPAGGTDLDPVLSAASANAVLRVSATGAELHWQATGGGEVRPLPALDPALADAQVAALEALDCHTRPVARLAALTGTCSTAVRTTDEVWSEEASYPLRPGTTAGQVLEALTAAVRAGAVPGAGGLPVEKVLLSPDDRVLAADRVLGARSSDQARHAAAVHGGAVLRDRFTVRDGRLLAASGPRADERLRQLATPGPAHPLPPELQRALATGRGRGGFLFLDLTALWKPYLKAAQVVESPLAGLVARRPDLIKVGRPMVITLEPGAALDATVTLPPVTVSFLLAVASLLFAG